MNCKPGDLARIIDLPATRMHGCVDLIVRVTNVDMEDEPMWHFEGPHIVCKCGCGCVAERISDQVLRPIRDPGDDAVDETLLIVPVPGEGVTA